MSGPRKRLPRDDRRRQIVAAAIGVFGKHGYHAATTAELARAAGVSEALLYQHFDSKKDLLLAAIAQIGEWVHEGLQEVLAATRDPKVTLLQLSDAFREFTRSHPDVPRLALALTAELDDPDISAAVREIVEDALGLLTRAMANGQKAGVLKSDVPAAALAAVVVSVYYSGGILRRLGLDERFDQETMLAMVRPFLGGAD